MKLILGPFNKYAPRPIQSMSRMLAQEGGLGRRRRREEGKVKEVTLRRGRWRRDR